MNYFNNYDNNNGCCQDENKQKYCFCKMAKQTCYYPTECFYCYKKEEKKDDCYDKFEEINNRPDWKEDCEDKQSSHKDNNRYDERCGEYEDKDRNCKNNYETRDCNQKNVEKKCECHHKCCFRNRWF